tara:strand:- start:357 stop:662 length:306 start_codon:yes stop_codon:yes gene_type:complete
MVNSKHDWERENVMGSIPDEQDILNAPRHKHRHPCLPRKGWRVMFSNGEEWNIARVLGVCENENREAKGQIYIEIGNGKTWRFAFWDNVYCYEYQDLIEQM